MAKTALLITTLLYFTSISLGSTASDYPGGGGNYYPGGGSGSSYPGADSYPGAGNYYPGAGSGSPSSIPNENFSVSNFPGASSYPGAGAGSYPGAGAGTGSYPGATGPAYSPGAGTPGPAVSCPGALNNANRAFDQLVDDLKKQAPQWSVFSDFDAVNEVSFFLKNSCNTTELQLVRVGPPSLVPSEEEACNELQAMLQNLLEENNSSDFRGGFEGAVDTSTKGLELGKQLGDNCQFELVQLNLTNVTNATNETDTSSDVDPASPAGPEPTLSPIDPNTDTSSEVDPTSSAVPEPTPTPAPEDPNTPPSHVLKTRFRVPAPVLRANSEDFGGEEETLVDDGEWDNAEIGALLAIDDLQFWAYFDYEKYYRARYRY